MEAATKPRPAVSPPRRLVAGGALASAIAQSLGLASLGLASIVIGRALGAGGFGVFAVALSLQLLLAALASAGIGHGIANEIARRRWPTGPALRRALSAALVLGAIGATAGLVIYLIAGDSLLPGVSGLAVACLLGSIPLAVAALILTVTASALERYEALGLLQAGPPLGIAVVGSFAALFFGRSATVAAIGIAAVIVGLLAAAWALRVARAAGRSEHGPLRMGDAARFGARIWGADVLALVNLRADLVLVGAVAGSHEAGIYGVPVTLMTLGLIIPHALAWVLLPRVASMDSAGAADEQDTVATIGQAGRHATLLAAASSPVLIGAVLLIPLVYGSSFSDSVPLGLVLVPGIAAFGVSRVLSYSLAGFGHPDTVLRVSAAVVLPSVAAYAMVIPFTGAMGAAIVSTISYAITLQVLAVAVRRHTGIGVVELLLPRRDDIQAYPEAFHELGSYFQRPALLRLVRGGSA